MSFLITNQNNFSHIPYPSPSYPRATVKTGGCGPCSVLNCVENMTPLRFKMADWIGYVTKNGGRIDGGTSIPAILKALKRDYGFDYEGSNDLHKIKAHLKNGGMAVFHVGGAYGAWKGLLSSAGHYVCLAGVDGSNAVVIDSGWYAGKYSGTWRKARAAEGSQNGVVYVNWTNLEKDKKYRDNSGTNYYLVTVPKEKEENDMIVYKTMNEIPQWGKATVEKLLRKGFLKGTGEGALNLTEDMLRVFVIHDRVGIYGE